MISRYLAVSGFRAVFAQIVMLQNMGWDSGFGRSQENTAKSEPGDVFKDVGVFDRFSGRLAPREGSVAGDKDTWNRDGIELVTVETADNDGAGVANVSRSNLFGCEGLGNRNRAVEVVGMRGAKAGDGPAGLSPGSGKLRMGVDDAADLGELAIEKNMGIEIA